MLSVRIEREDREMMETEMETDAETGIETKKDGKGSQAEERTQRRGGESVSPSVGELPLLAALTRRSRLECTAGLLVGTAGQPWCFPY